MHLHEELAAPLLSGLATSEQQQILRIMERVRDEQLHRKQNPPKRRRRDTDGVLRMPDELS